MKKLSKQYVTPVPGQIFKNGCGMDVTIDRVEPGYIVLCILHNPTPSYGRAGLKYTVGINGKLGGDTPMEYGNYDIPIDRTKATKRSRLY